MRERRWRDGKDWPPQIEQPLGILGTLDVIVMRMERHLLEPVQAGDRSEEILVKADRY